MKHEPNSFTECVKILMADVFADFLYTTVMI